MPYAVTAHEKRPIIVEKTVKQLDGASARSFCACGPARQTEADAERDAHDFERLQYYRRALEAVVAHAAPDDELSDPNGGRWVGDSAILACRIALGLEEPDPVAAAF